MSKPKITSLDCKNAILDWLKERPLFVLQQFSCDENPENICIDIFTPGGTVYEITNLDELNAVALKRTNWKRFEKYHNQDGSVVRGFNCAPFDDQLRGYVTEKNNEIISVEVVGE